VEITWVVERGIPPPPPPPLSAALGLMDAAPPSLPLSRRNGRSFARCARSRHIYVNPLSQLKNTLRRLQANRLMNEKPCSLAAIGHYNKQVNELDDMRAKLWDIKKKFRAEQQEVSEPSRPT